jgi:hypothetical protein
MSTAPVELLLCGVGGTFFSGSLPKLRHPKSFVLTVLTCLPDGHM